MSQMILKGFEIVKAHIRLADYMQLRKKQYTNDDCGLSRLVLKDRATKIAEKVLPPDLLHGLKASDGFIEKVLIGVSLHGEGNEMSEEKADALMRPFRGPLGESCEKNNIPIE